MKWTSRNNLLLVDWSNKVRLINKMIYHYEICTLGKLENFNKGLFFSSMVVNGLLNSIFGRTETFRMPREFHSSRTTFTIIQSTIVLFKFQWIGNGTSSMFGIWIVVSSFVTEHNQRFKVRAGADFSSATSTVRWHLYRPGRRKKLDVRNVNFRLVQRPILGTLIALVTQGSIFFIVNTCRATIYQESTRPTKSIFRSQPWIFMIEERVFRERRKFATLSTVYTIT